MGKEFMGVSPCYCCVLGSVSFWTGVDLPLGGTTLSPTAYLSESEKEERSLWLVPCDWIHMHFFKPPFWHALLVSEAAPAVTLTPTLFQRVFGCFLQWPQGGICNGCKLHGRCSLHLWSPGQTTWVFSCAGVHKWFEKNLWSDPQWYCHSNSTC